MGGAVGYLCSSQLQCVLVCVCWYLLVCVCWCVCAGICWCVCAGVCVLVFAGVCVLVCVLVCVCWYLLVCVCAGVCAVLWQVVCFGHPCPLSRHLRVSPQFSHDLVWKVPEYCRGEPHNMPPHRSCPEGLAHVSCTSAVMTQWCEVLSG